MVPIIPQYGIPRPLNHQVGMLTYYESNHPTGMEYYWSTTIGLECPYTSKHVYITCNHITLYIINILGTYHPTGMEYPLLRLNMHMPQVTSYQHI